MNKKKMTKNRQVYIQLELLFSAEDRLQMLTYDRRYLQEHSHEMNDGDKRPKRRNNRRSKKGGRP